MYIAYSKSADLWGLLVRPQILRIFFFFGMWELHLHTNDSNPEVLHKDITMPAAKTQRERDGFFWIKNSTVVYFLKGGQQAALS